MPVIIRVIANEFTGKTFLDVPIYLQSADIDAHDGRGSASWTTERADAMRFTNVAAAMAFWTSSPKARPTREDGAPNRPLTAFTIEVQDEREPQP